MDTLQMNHLQKLVIDLFGGANRMVQIENNNGITVSIFQKYNGYEEEVHYAYFETMKDAIKFYSRKIVEKPVVANGELVKYDGAETLIGYENQPVDDVIPAAEKALEWENRLAAECLEKNKSVVQQEIFEEAEFKVLGYRPRRDFTNENGKVFVKIEVEVAMDLVPIDNIKERIDYYTEINPAGFESNGWTGNNFNTIFDRISKYLMSVNSKIKTAANTNMSIYEVFFGNKKVDRV